MTEHDAFALGRSNLNGFLFAEIGVEGSGMPLSVISALARMGLDPWQEAGRLAGLPRTVATDGLARLIATMPASPWPMPDATPIAARLVALLPGQNDSPAIVAMQIRLNWRWLLIAAMTMALLFSFAAHLASVPGTTGSGPAQVSAPIHPVQPLVGD